MGKDYWKGMIQWMKETMLDEHGCISSADLDRLLITDNPEEVANGIERHYQKDRAKRNF
jgi:predicted Rossmann-fold nucleotide-binding protein